MRRRILFCLLTAMLTALPAAAQFNVNGSEPAGLRWYQIKTPDYKLIYPEGLDSLAKVYAARLEQIKEPVGATAGYTPNQCFRKQLPVVLHPWVASANGMVSWTPSRMLLYTTPDFSGPLPIPWEEHLTLHESRHVSQMQFVYEKPYRFGTVLLGQLYQGAAAVVYCGPAFYEGDAVVAETELTEAGRGRNAEFLEYYRAAFREGDTRDWWQWRYGSLKNYAPDYYKLGYITAAGMRTLYDAPDFTARYYERIFRKKLWPWPFFNYPATVKEVSGKKFREAFTEICDTLRREWSRDEAARAPFQPARRLTGPRSHYVDYSGTCVINDTLYSIRRGMTEAPQLVRLAPGEKEPKVLGPFAYSTSALKENLPLHRIYWSEIVSDVRWTMKSYSEVWYMEQNGRRHCLKRRTRWYNPSVSPDGGRLSVVEWDYRGGTSLLVLDALSGEELERFPAPDGMQLTESEWIGDELYACAVTSDGQGIYKVRDAYCKLLDCGRSSVRQLFVHDGTLCFTSDLNGVDELYGYVPGEAVARRLSSTPAGASSFRFTGSSLVYSEQSHDGRFIKATPLYAMLDPAEADFGNRHRYVFAEELTAGGPGVVPSLPDSLEVAEPAPYNRLANAFRFHSWMPLYVDYDAIADRSFENLMSSASLGAMAFFHNDLENFYGSVGYSAACKNDNWTHKGELRFTYTGLFPVIECSFSVSSDPSEWYYLRRSFNNFGHYITLTSEDTAFPNFNASVLAYVPLTFSSGGWYRGFIPQIRWALSNSVITRGHSAPMNRLSASVRGYVIKATPEACVYPKLGIGAEAGWIGRPGALETFKPNAYFYTYGYLPGFMDTHGMRLSAVMQFPHGDGMFKERAISIMPRGMGAYSSLASNMAQKPVQGRVTLDYAFPFAPLDWSGMGPVAYVRNLECTLHGDYAFFGGAANAAWTHLGAAGAELCVVLGNLLWIPYDTRIGVKYYYNIGIPTNLNPHRFDLVFNVDF